MRDRIEIDKALVPYRFTIALGQLVFEMELHYNAALDGYVCHLYKGGELLCGGEKLVYGRPLFADCYEVEQYPPLRLVPLDESGTAEEVSEETLGTLVFLTVDNLG